MAQILDLSKRYSKEQIDKAREASGSPKDLPAGGYICKIVDAILNDDAGSGKANIELHVDIAVGEFAGHFQALEDRYGFWGLKGWMSFKESQIPRFQQTCAALCQSNPGLVFNPLAGAVDIDILKGKMIGVVIGKEEYDKDGDIREKNVVSYFTDVDKIKNNKFKIPKLKKLVQERIKDDFESIDTESVAVPF